MLERIGIWNVGIWGERKTGAPKQKPLRARGREPTTNSSNLHVWHYPQDLHLGHISGKRVVTLTATLSFLSLPHNCRRQEELAAYSWSAALFYCIVHILRMLMLYRVICMVCGCEGLVSSLRSIWCHGNHVNAHARDATIIITFNSQAHLIQVHKYY